MVDGNNKNETSENQSDTLRFKGYYKILGILLMVFSILLLFALGSYNKLDESLAQFKLIDYLGLIGGDEKIIGQVARVHNLLGITGAAISYALYRYTIGFSIIVFPIFIFFWAINLFRLKKTSSKFIRFFVVYLIVGLMFASLMGAMQHFPWGKEIPWDWSGAIGFYLSSIIANSLHPIAAVVIFVFIMIVSIIAGTDWTHKKIFKNKDANDITTFENNDKIDIAPEDTIHVTKTDDKTINSINTVDIDAVKDYLESNPIGDSTAFDVISKKNEDNILEEDELSLDIDFSSIDDSNITTSLDVKKTFTKPEIIEEPKEIEIIDNGLKIIIEKSHKNGEAFLPYIENAEDDEDDYELTSINTQSTNKTNNLSNSQSDYKLNLDDDEWKIEPLNRNIAQNNTNQNPILDSIITNEEMNDSSEKELVQSEPDIHIAEKPKRKPLIIEVEEINIQPEFTSPLGTYIHDEEIHYKFPDFSLLNTVRDDTMINESELKANAQILREKLETFKIFIDDLKVTPGPVVTQYEFTLAPGIKVSRIESLADDLAMALKAKGIRVIAPIPGKGTVGVEIPNSQRATVSFYDVVNTAAFANTTAKLPMALGKTISGDIYIADLAKMPHLLIAGATGAGKSVGINTIICSLLYKKHPSELKFVIVDPKKVEMQQYSDLAHLFIAKSPEVPDDIITAPEDAILALNSTVIEMERRYDILASVRLKNISEYNAKIKSKELRTSGDISHRPMPYIVVIIDELADLMLTASKEIEKPITRLAQMARAVGIHLVIATQRPSVDVITGLIKANFPARIAYAVSSKIDSRTILDMQGAEKLLGMGDMLCMPPGLAKPVRIQNAFIDTDEVEKICQYFDNQEGYSSSYMLPSVNENGNDDDNSTSYDEDRDSLFEEAARLVIIHQQGSVSLIQRRLGVGYARAGRIVDQLEKAGVVGKFKGSKARDVIMESESELQRIL